METKEKQTPKKDNWEYKDRNYYLLGSKTPLTFTITSRHSKRYPCVWFDSEKGYEREMRYATNQKSIFVDEQNGPATLKHIVFLFNNLLYFTRALIISGITISFFSF